MTWEITVSVLEKAKAMPLNRALSVESGQHANVVEEGAGRRGIPACTAVACSRPERLALVLASSAGVRVDGRPVPCPLIAIDTRGGKVSLSTPGGSVTLNVSYEARPVLTPSGSRVCCLCHDALENGETANCPHCGRLYHGDCLPLVEGRCAACAQPAKAGQ